MARRALFPLFSLLTSLLMLIAAVSGCTSEVDGPIDYTVSGGFTGTGDGTALHVDLNGTVTRLTQEHGTQTATLDPQALDDLRAKIVDADFTTLEPRYACACADDYIYRISVQLDGKRYTVEADSMAQYPERLKAVIEALKDIHQRPLDWH